MNAPRLFDDKGQLLDVDTRDMDAATLQRLETVRAAYQANKEATDVLTAAYAQVAAATEAVKNTEAYFDADYPKQTFHDLWVENFGGGPRNRLTGVARM